jgi:hypothetical protein
MTPTRKELAEALKDEIHKLGGFVISPMPLADNARMRFQLLQPDEKALQRLRDLAFDPILISYGLRFQNNAAVPCATYEIFIPPERQEIIDARTIPKDEVGRRGHSHETQAIVDEWYGMKKR